MKLYNDPVLTAMRGRLQNESLENGDGEGHLLPQGSMFLVPTSRGGSSMAT